MQIETAIREYLIEQRETVVRQQVELEIAALARLQEYLEEDATLTDTAALRAEDLHGFLRHWYRQSEDVAPETVERLAASVLGWARWVDEHGAPGPGQARISAAVEPLARELPRTARAAEILRRHVHRGDLGEPIPVADVAGGSPLGTISAGVTRVVRPAEIDYARAEEDTFEVVAVAERSVSLHTTSWQELGEMPAGPVAVPPAAARLLRIGDILHVEIAPTSGGWEVLNVEAVYPGGWDDRP